MDETPTWFDPDDVAAALDELDDRNEEAAARREACLDAIDDADVETAETRKREYQLSAYKARQQEGEILWAALGHAITDLAERGLDPDDDGVEARGTAFVEWAVDSGTLASVHTPDRVRLVVARRAPTIPEAHEPYVRSMLGLSEQDLNAIRGRDRQMLDAAGWLRRGRRGATEMVEVPCPRCEGVIPVRVPDDATVDASTSFVGADDEMREICPHCERDVFVVADS